MSNYTKSTNFAAKDSLPSGNANKVVKGTEINTEFDNIATAITSKADLNSPTLVTPNLGTPSAAVLTNATGLPLTTGVTGTLPVANGGTGATTFSSGALLKGAGTSAITTATAGTDYAPATSGTSILKGNGSGGFSSVVSGTDIKTINSTSLLGSGDIAITLTPGGSNTQVQYNNAGAFGGSANFVFDGTNVGIGTSSPSYLLHAAGTNPRINVSASSTGYTGYRASNTSGTFQVAIDDSTGSNYLGTAYGRVIYSDGAYPLQFATNATERMRITSGGTLCIATTTAVSGSYLTVNGKAAFASNLVLEDGGGVGWSGNPTVRNTAGSGYLIMMNGTTGGVGLTNGGTSWTSISDERYKTNLAPIANGLQKVSQLRSVTGRFINDEEDKSRSFLIAQDVQQVLPEAISVADDGRMLLSYTDTIPLLVAAIKDLKAIVDAQAARISALEGN